VEFLEDEETVAKAYEARASSDDIAGQPTKSFVQPFRISLVRSTSGPWAMS
jgi:hypothetical protein